MTPALLFLGAGGGAAATVVAADLTAAAIYKTGGAVVHSREGSPNLQLAKWLVIGSVPMAGWPYVVKALTDNPDELDSVLKTSIWFATAAGRRDLRPAALHQPAPRVRSGGFQGDPTPKVRPIPTLLVGDARACCS